MHGKGTVLLKNFNVVSVAFNVMYFYLLPLTSLQP